MKRILTALLALTLSFQGFCQQKSDTLKVSSTYTTHIIFNTDLIYADISNSQVMAAKILEQSRNMMALKAREPFTTPLSVSALESNGSMHTFIVKYEADPQSLVYDQRLRDEPNPTDSLPQVRKKKDRNGSGEGTVAGLYRKRDAPLLSEVVDAKQTLWHISKRQYDIDVTCINIITYSDITYLVFNLENHSGVSYECSDATFVVESKKQTKKSVVYDKNIFPKSRFGTISCEPGKNTKIGYSLDKLSLSKDQILKVYFYEKGGQRELVLTINPEDINKARTKLGK